MDLHAGPVQLAAELGLPASTIGQVLRRWAVPRLADLHRITGELLRQRVTDERYEHARPGDLLHVDVEKLGRIPDGGIWRLDGENVIGHHRKRNKPEPIGYDCSDSDELFQAADAALLQAKSNGRDRTIPSNGTGRLVPRSGTPLSS